MSTVRTAGKQPQPGGDAGRSEPDAGYRADVRVPGFGGELIFQSLLDSAPDAMVIVATDGQIMLVNRQTEAIFGYPREELLGRPIEILVPEQVRELHARLRAGYVADRQPRPMGAGKELAGRRKNGTQFPAEISLNAVKTGDHLLIVAAIRDDSERVRAERKFRGLLEAAPDAILGVNPAGCIALVNAQAERLFGYTRDELVGQPVELLVPEGARAIHPAHRSNYFANPEARPMGAGIALAARRKDGSEFPAEISLSALEIEDGLLVSAAVRDVSDRIEAQAERERLKAEAERERLERQLHQSQRLESLGQLAGGVAHDFNNLLGVILNYASFVADEVAAAANANPGQRWESVQRDVEQIQRAAERAARLTHQLLAFGRREVVRPRALNLNDVVVDLEQLLLRTIAEHVELNTSLEPALWPIMADPGQIEQVLVNLAVNARDAMPTGGTLTIDTANVVLGTDDTAGMPSGRYARLRVSDTGIGMEPAVCEHAFEPFFTTKAKGEGSGLGLATVYGIITQAGGYVQIYSEPGHGTTFRAFLPTTDELAAAAELPSSAERAVGGETVLVVEDEEAMREVTKRMLQRNGYQVMTAATGAEALDLVRRHQDDLDLLLTDVVMPQMLGKELVDRIRTMQSDLRVLYMSGYAHPVLASQGTLDAGVTLLEKPFSESALTVKVREVLDA